MKDNPEHPEVALGAFNPNGLKKLVVTLDDPKVITDPEQLRLIVDPPKPDIVVAKEVKKLPAFLETQKLRDVHGAAVAYWHGTGDRTLMDALAKALAFADSVEDPTTFFKCIVCGDRIPVGKMYCGFDCAETDGAIEK